MKKCRQAMEHNKFHIEILAVCGMAFTLNKTALIFLLIMHGGLKGPSTIEAAPDNKGSEFIIGYLESKGWRSNPSLDPELYVTTMKTTTVNVQIRAPLYTTSTIDESFTINAGEVRQFSFSNDIRVSGDSLSDKGIWVTADDEIVIYGVNPDPYSNDAFLGIPTDVLGTEYYIITWSPPDNQCEMLVIGVNDSTTVNILLSAALGSSTVSWNGNTYTQGQTITVTINRYQTLQLTSNGDLTGSYITSDKIIAVISGNQRTTVGSGSSSDHLIEQWPPVNTYGKTFATVPIPGRTIGDYFKVVASEANTQVSVNGSSYSTSFTLSLAGSHQELDIPSEYYCYIQADKPVLIAQFCKSQTSSSEKSDPMMVMIPPIELFAADYTFTTPTYSGSGSYTNYFMFVVTDSEKTGLLADGASFPASTDYNSIPGTKLMGGYITLTEGMHTVRHTSTISVFGGYLFGTASYETYGFPTGSRFASINSVCVATTTVTGDGLDNDCDGLIDEELCTDANDDDDNDGSLNEDCATPFPIDGNWTDWSEWSACSVTCSETGSSITGTMTRSRNCSNPEPQYDGQQCSGDSVESQSCSTSANCPVNGNWTDWSAWSTCSITCTENGNNGILLRSRDCTNPSPQYGGDDCSGDSNETQSCTVSTNCPIDGNWNDWSAWSSCSVTCSDDGSSVSGTVMRSRNCTNPSPQYNGNDCGGDSNETQSCSTTSNCPVNGNWTDWSAWSTCSITCTENGNNGSLLKSRDCTNPSPQYGGDDCSGDSNETQSCTVSTNCPIDGNWNDWSAWSSCSVTCSDDGSSVSGTMMRSRNCTNPSPQYNGNDCIGDSNETQSCSTTTNCPVNGNWSDWSMWSSCSVTCFSTGSFASGISLRSRNCSNPEPQYNGDDCSGDSNETQICSTTTNCPVHGNWTDWTAWSSCSVTCTDTGSSVSGTMMRSRNCTNPEPQYNGDYCGGDDNETQSCSTTTNCPVDGNWTDWSTWSSCSVTCTDIGSSVNGTMVRSRNCTNPPPQYGGEDCTGGDNDTTICVPTTYCPVDGNWTDWSTWSSCSVSCTDTESLANGTTFRTRNCTNPPPQYNGNECSGDNNETEICSTSTRCPVNGNWADWLTWSSCSLTCTDTGSSVSGSMTRSRNCTNPPPQYNGDDCSGDSDETTTCLVSTDCPGLADVAKTDAVSSSEESLTIPALAGIIAGSVIGPCCALGLIAALRRRLRNNKKKVKPKEAFTHKFGVPDHGPNSSTSNLAFI